MINVLIVDNDELACSGIEGLLNATEDIKVVGIAKSGEEAVDTIATLPVDIVLIEVNMPGISCTEVCRRILQYNPEVKIITLAVNNVGTIPPQLLKLGVLGFISKESPVNELINAIRKVMTGDRYLSSDVARNLATLGLPGYHESPFSKLSRRESEVVNLILQGKSIKEMSQMLILSDKTAILIMTNTYPIPGLGRRTLRLSGV